MIAVDTNILVRFLVRDDEQQAQSVYQRFKQAERDQQSLRVPILVVLELIWVLESAYEMTRAQILTAIESLQCLAILRFSQQQGIEQFVHVARHNTIDLSDLLIAHSAQAEGCDQVLTFDKKAAKSPLFSLLQS